jgi:Flp pilus assembly protein TadG
MRQLQKLRGESGQAMTEFALVMPFLILLLFAIVEGGLTLNNYLKLTDAVRVGARIASINGSLGQASAQQAATSALTNAADGVTLEGVTVTADQNQWQSGYAVTVQASTEYHITLPLLGQILSGTLTSHSTQRIE